MNADFADFTLIHFWLADFEVPPQYFTRFYLQNKTDKSVLTGSDKSEATA
jgi:hypothetical protein